MMYTVDQIFGATWLLVSTLILVDILLTCMLIFIIKTYLEFKDIFNKSACQYAMLFLSVSIVLVTIWVSTIVSCWTNYSLTCTTYLF
ncbi:hypothetical protein [Pseudomonas phage vB_PA32_GUMS]|nr:hypothetical protein [Pseudomonas phage vB_PA32_GUMS]